MFIVSINHVKISTLPHIDVTDQNKNSQFLGGNWKVDSKGALILKGPRSHNILLKKSEMGDLLCQLASLFKMKAIVIKNCSMDTGINRAVV